MTASYFLKQNNLVLLFCYNKNPSVSRVTMSKKIVLIARVSDVEQRQALPAQKLRLQNYARQFGVNKIQYFEFDESAYKDSRQKFAELIQKIQSDDSEQIVAFDKIDRFTRDASQKEVRIMSGLVQKGKVELHFPSDNLIITKDSPATDLFRLGIGMLLAKYYSDASRDNVKRRFEQMRSEGLYPHKAPIGYKNVQKHSASLIKPAKTIIVDAKLAPFVIKAFELRSQGLPYRDIAKELSEQGFKIGTTNGVVSHNVIARMLANKFYIGVMTCDGKQYPHRYSRLVSKDIFEQCQFITQQRQISNFKTKYNSKIYILKGLVGCGQCNHVISSYDARNNVYLRCASSNCKNTNTAEALLLPSIAKALKSLAMPAQVAQTLQDRLLQKEARQMAKSTQIKQKIANINTQIDTLYSDRLVGRITARKHDQLVAKLENKRQNLKNQSNILTSAPNALQNTISQMIYVCQNAHKLFQKAETSIKNSMLEILLSNIELKNKKLSFSMNFPSWRVEEIQTSGLKISNCPAWWGWEDLNHRPRHYQ